MSPEVRAKLAAEQAKLVAALVQRAAPPAGFDVERIDSAARALVAKRRRAVVRAWPGLVSALHHFAAYAATHAPPQMGGALSDGREFVRYLARNGAAPDALVVQALEVDLRLASRFWPTCKFAWLRYSRRLVVGIRLPIMGVYILGQRGVLVRGG